MTGVKLIQEDIAVQPAWSIRPIRGMEVEDVFALVARVFNQFEAPDYSAEGVNDFFQYANSAAARGRADTHAILVGEMEGTLAGMVEVRFPSHMSLLFVEAAMHGRGYGRALCDAGINLLLQKKPDLEKMTVNSSPYAIGFYEKLGFNAVSEEQVIRGIRFTPMEWLLKPKLEMYSAPEANLHEG